MPKAYLEERQSPFLSAMLIFDTVWDELKNVLSLGFRLRRQRELPISPCEVLVVDGAAVEQSKLAAHVTHIAEWWGLGSARARNTIEFSTISTSEKVLLSRRSTDERRPEFEPGVFPKAWLLVCRHGHEVSLARRLRRHVRRVSRRTGFSYPMPFITPVPFIFLESAATPAMNVVIGPQVANEPQTWTPTLGIFDTDVDDAALSLLPQPPQLTWHGTVIDQGQNQPLTVSNHDIDRVPNSHGTAVAAIAASKARVEIHFIGSRPSDRLAPWLPAISASFLVKALETLKNCDVINLSMTVDQTVSDVAARFEDALSWILETMVDSGTIIVSAVGRARLIRVQQPSGDYLLKFIRTAGFPASLSHVIAVGSDDPSDRNEGVSGPHIIVHFDPGSHLCTVNGKPFLGSSAACAYVSGQICNYLGASSSPSEKRVERARGIQRRERHAFMRLTDSHAGWTNEVTYLDAT